MRSRLQLLAFATFQHRDVPACRNQSTATEGRMEQSMEMRHAALTD